MQPLSRPFLAFSACVLLVAGASAQAPKKTLTLEQTAGRGEDRVDLRGTTPAWSWAPDGVHLVRGRGAEARWVDPRTFEESEPRVKQVEAEPEAEAEADPEAEPAQGGGDEAAVAQAFAALDGVDEELAEQLARRRRMRNADGAAFAVEHEGRLWFYRAGEGARRVAGALPASFELAELSPGGGHLAFVSENDLVLVDTLSGAQRAVTSDGGETFNGKLDWVYQEEIYGRGDFKAFWWSPDSSKVAFLKLDESAVHDFTVVDHIEDGHFRVRPEVTNYPKAGDPNPAVHLGIADARDGSVAWIDLARYRSEEPLVVRVGWTPDGERVVFMVQDRIQSWLDLDVGDPESGELATWIHEGSKSWVERLPAPRWLADGTFLWESDRTGYRHVYRYRPGGELVGAVTAGDWAVRDVSHVDEQKGLLWFEATRDGAVDRNTYRIGLDGKGLVRLTQGRGTHSTSFNGDRSFFLDRVSSLDAPTRVRLCTGDGALVRELGSTAVPALEEYALSTWELLSIPARDGFQLDAALLKPVGFDPGERYPVWLPTYSGPDSPSVRNAWNTSLWYQFLAQNGFLVFQVNVRTASGKGQWATEQGYLQLGVLELRDLEDAVAWLTKEPWADAGRVGITGGSYGGFMTAYALCNSKAFALGIAGSGVYDWGMYDTIYTERYMSTPQKNPEGYARTSVIRTVAGLEGHLLLYHGVMDDNVHVQNAMQLVYALQRAGKDFDFMLYPQNRHGIRDGAQRWHLRRMEWRAMRDALGGREPAPAATAAGT